MRQIAKKTAEQLAAEELREYILSGRATPDERLTEQQLADKLGVSRGTVRAALHQLSRDGLISQTPYSEWRVAAFGARDVWELYSLRASLEGLATRLAASRSGEEREPIESAFDALIRACKKDNRRLIAEADFRFHKAIVEVSGHRRLSSLYSLVEQQIRTVIASSDALVSDVQNIVEQHQPILDAISRGNPEDAAKEAMHHNIVEGRKLVVALDPTINLTFGEWPQS